MSRSKDVAAPQKTCIPAPCCMAMAELRISLRPLVVIYEGFSKSM